MIQGGIVSNTQSPIEGEFSDNGIENSLLHTVGVISMARTSDMNSATSQFFIMDKTTTSLDGKYASFGGLTSGFNVLEYLSKTTTLAMDRPLEPVIIESITVELNGYVPDSPTYYQK
jgi:peptidyl-prolyl cis-trans isomerase B (cyclophilin B)